MNRIGVGLSELYGIPETDYRPVLHTFFTDIENMVSLKPVIIESSVSTFFDHIFPVMYKRLIFNGTEDAWTHHYTHCISKYRSTLVPQPFGDLPQKVAKNLNGVLSQGHAYIRALHVILETLNTTESLILDDQCRNAMARMQYCSHCRYILHAKPCTGYCLDVMRGCLAGLSEIGPEWNDIITMVEGLVREMNDQSLDELFQSLILDILNSAMKLSQESVSMAEKVRLQGYSISVSCKSNIAKKNMSF